MNNNELTIMSARATTINKLHTEVCEGLRTSVDKAIQIGELLVLQKKECGHGNWIEWMDENLTFTARTATDYIKLYENRLKLVANQQTSSDLPTNSGGITIEAALQIISAVPDEPVKELKTKSPSKRGTARLAFIKKHAIPEVLEALESEQISISTAENIAHVPKEGQLAALNNAPAARLKPEPQTAPAQPAPEPTAETPAVETPPSEPAPSPPSAKPKPPSEPEVKSGKPCKPEDHIPYHLLGGIITGDLLVKGRAVSKDEHGKWCDLPVGISKLRRDEEVAFLIGGSPAFSDRKAYYKWQDYDKKKIRDKVLKVLAQMGPLDIPKPQVGKSSAAIYEYNLGVSSDLGELVEMLCADLRRQVEMLENKEKFGHLYASKTLHPESA